MTSIPKNTIKTLLYLAFIGLGIPFLLSFLNALHPLFDSFSHFRVHLMLALIPTMLILALFHKRKNRLRYFGLVVMGALYLYVVTQPFTLKEIDPTKTHMLKHIQFNLNFRNQEMDKVVEYFKNSNADVITLEEVTVAHQMKLQEMKKAYPYQAYCEFYPVVGSVAILSKHPFNKKNTTCLKGKGLLWSQIMVNEKPINIVAIHTLWPFPYGQPQQIAEIKPILKKMTPPTLIAGDFNAVSWSHTIKEIEEASKTKVVEGMRWTIDLKKQVPLIPNFKLAIDQLLLSSEFQVINIYVEKDLGSDHFPVVDTIKY